MLQKELGSMLGLDSANMSKKFNSKSPYAKLVTRALAALPMDVAREAIETAKAEIAKEDKNV